MYVHVCVVHECMYVMYVMYVHVVHVHRYVNVNVD